MGVCRIEDLIVERVVTRTLSCDFEDDKGSFREEGSRDAATATLGRFVQKPTDLVCGFVAGWLKSRACQRLDSRSPFKDSWYTPNAMMNWSQVH